MKYFHSYLKYLQYHELIGLEVIVISCFGKYNINVKGIIVDETKNMFKIKTKINSTFMFPKYGSIFLFKLENDVINKDNLKKNYIFIKMDGNKLISRPQNRTKNLKKNKKEM